MRATEEAREVGERENEEGKREEGKVGREKRKKIEQGKREKKGKGETAPRSLRLLGKGGVGRGEGVGK